MGPTLERHIRVADEGVYNVRHGPDQVFRGGRLDDGIVQVVQCLFKILFVEKSLERKALENQLKDSSESWIVLFIDHQGNQVLVVWFTVVFAAPKKVLYPGRVRAPDSYQHLKDDE